jgi:hypothetical protein
MSGHPPAVRGSSLEGSRARGWTEVAVTLDEILASHRPHILRRWLDLIYALYPPETKAFLETQDDPVANPVGQTMRDAAEALYERLCRPPTTAPCPALERLMRLRAVQGICPSQAVSFLLALKRLVRAEVTPSLLGPALHADLETIDDRIDTLTLQAVDLFTAYREHLSVLQVHEARRSTQKLLERLQREHTGEEDA